MPHLELFTLGFVGYVMSETTIKVNLKSFLDQDSISQGIEHFNSCLNGDWYKIQDDVLEINPTDFATLLNFFLKERMSEFDWHRLRRNVEKLLQEKLESKVGDVQEYEHALDSIYW